MQDAPRAAEAPSVRSAVAETCAFSNPFFRSKVYYGSVIARTVNASPQCTAAACVSTWALLALDASAPVLWL